MPAKTSCRERIRVAVLFGGRSPEHDVSRSGALSALRAMDPRRYDVLPIHISHDGVWTSTDVSGHKTDNARVVVLDPSSGELLWNDVDGTAQRFDRPDVVFPLLHGPQGEDGTIQGLLELAGLPYVGCGVLASALCMDKDWTKRLASVAGVPVVPYAVVDARSADLDRVELPRWPVFVKPATGGSSIGVGRAATRAEFVEAVQVASAYDAKVIVESGVDGIEVMCGVLEEPGGRLIASPLAEVPLGGTQDSFFDFATKYGSPHQFLTVPARVSPAVAEHVQRLARTTFGALGCRDLARVDFFVTAAGTVLLNEVNTMPGFTAASLFPQLWASQGLNYPELIDRLIDNVLRRSPSPAASSGGAVSTDVTDFASSMA